MSIRSLIWALALSSALSAQTFIQMSDPQFGMYAKDASFEHETANFEFAIATANRLKPAFVVITGDLINQSGNAAQTAEFHRIAGKLDPQIRLFNVAGNHDVGNDPTLESLARYRERFGKDYYTFRIGDIAGFVVNSSLLKAPAKVADEAAKMESWLKGELARAEQDGVKHLFVFQHIPPFVKEPNEADGYDNLPLSARVSFLKLLHEYGVNHLFAGHCHVAREARDGDLEIHIAGPVGMPLKGGKSGMLIGAVSAAVNAEPVTHRYYDFGELPEALQ